jgi:hypothetical protein
MLDADMQWRHQALWSVMVMESRRALT